MEVMALSGKSENGKLLERMHEMRARVFRDRKGWPVHVNNGLEVDEFDTPNARYIAVVADGNVVACVRFLELTGPTMIGTTFSQLLEGPLSELPTQGIESSRFCVDTEKLRSRDTLDARTVTATLVSGMLGWAALHQYTSIVTVTDLGIERLLRRLGVPFARLGAPKKLNNSLAVAGIIPVSVKLARDTAPAALA
jgi:N-acyl-L-homoserine lactone synthetase